MGHPEAEGVELVHPLQQVVEEEGGCTSVVLVAAMVGAVPEIAAAAAVVAKEVLPEVPPDGVLIFQPGGS